MCNGVLRPPIRDEWKEPDSDEAKLVEIMVICWAQKPEDRPDLEDVLELLDDIIGRRRRRRMEERGEGGNGVGGVDGAGAAGGDGKVGDEGDDGEYDQIGAGEDPENDYDQFSDDEG